MYAHVGTDAMVLSGGTGFVSGTLLKRGSRGGYVESITAVEPVRRPAPLRVTGQLATNVGGLWTFALGVVLTLRSGLGLGPWDVLHQGISRHTPLTFGQASEVVGAIVIGVGLLLQVRPGLGTVLNMI